MGARLASANSEAEAKVLGNLARFSNPSFPYTFVGRFHNGRDWVTLDGIYFFLFILPLFYYFLSILNLLVMVGKKVNF